MIELFCRIRDLAGSLMILNGCRVMTDEGEGALFDAIVETRRGPVVAEQPATHRVRTRGW